MARPAWDQEQYETSSVCEKRFIHASERIRQSLSTVQGILEGVLLLHKGIPDEYDTLGLVYEKRFIHASKSIGKLNH